MRSWLPPTADELTRVAVLCARAEGRAYFFDRLENPRWVEPLAESDFFSSPPGPVPAEEEGYVRFPPWPEGRYLARVAADEPRAVAKVLAGIEPNGNPTVVALLLKIVASLPRDESLVLWPKVQEWTASPLAEYFASEATSLVPHLLDQGMTSEALAVAASILAVLPDPQLREKANLEELPYLPTPEPVSRFSEWEYLRALSLLVPLLVDAVGLGAVQLFARLLNDALRLSTWEDRSPTDDLSYIWRAAIEDHAQNSDHGIKSALVVAVRDSAIRFAAQGSAELEATVGLLESGSTTERRVALYLLAITPDGPRLAADRMLDRALFDDYRIRHEYADLLRARFGELDPVEQGEVLAWIEAGPDVDDYRQRRAAIDMVLPSDEDVARYSDLWRRDHYSFVSSDLAGDNARHYEELVARLGEPEHPDFFSWSSSWTGPESPTTKDDLVEREPEDVVEYLSTWLPDNDAGWQRGPSIEGLGRILSEVVASRPEAYATLASGFADLDPTYVRALFSGLETAVQAEETFSWNGPLELATSVVRRPFEPEARVPDRDRDPGWGWCRRQIGSLVRVGLSDRPTSIPFELRVRLWNVIEPLSRDPNPTAEHEARYGGDNMDPMTLSINTNRGTAMHAVVEYALWCRRNLEASKVDVSPGFELIPEAGEVLDAHMHTETEPSVAVRAVFGRWLPWLFLLDQQWTIERLPLLFPPAIETNPLADAVWDTYIAWCPPYDSVLEILMGEYRAAVDRVPTGRKAGSFGYDTVDSKLGEHLVTFYWRGILERDLLEDYFDRADDELAAETITFVGRTLQNTAGNVAPSILQRIQDLWDWRDSQCTENVQDHERELRSFGTWFVSGKLDPGWSLAALERSVDRVGAPSFGHPVAKGLVRVSASEPLVAVRILSRMLDKPADEWGYVGWLEEARAIVQAALASGIPEAIEEASSVVDFYVRHGELGFRELIRPANPE